MIRIFENMENYWTEEDLKIFTVSLTSVSLSFLSYFKLDLLNISVI